MKDYSVLDELVPKTEELHRAIFDKGYEQYGFTCGLVSAWMSLPLPYQEVEE